MSWLRDLHALQFAGLAEFLAQVEDELVELLGRHADGDRPLHLAVGELVAVDGGDEAALDAGDELGDGRRSGGVERVDLELDVAGADDDSPRRFGANAERVGGLLGLPGGSLIVLWLLGSIVSRLLLPRLLLLLVRRLFSVRRDRRSRVIQHRFRLARLEELRRQVLRARECGEPRQFRGRSIRHGRCR